ncbi:uncharacterized protein ACBT44_021379 isoform 1-T1 [Syngnathus typhle]
MASKQKACGVLKHLPVGCTDVLAVTSHNQQVALSVTERQDVDVWKIVAVTQTWTRKHEKCCIVEEKTATLQLSALRLGLEDTNIISRLLFNLQVMHDLSSIFGVSP